MSKRPAQSAPLKPTGKSAEVATAGAVRSPARRRYRYRRRHTPHFYIVIAALTCAAVVCALNTIGFASGNVGMAIIAFGAVCVTTLVVCAAFFWGFYMLMSGNIPVKRLKIFLPHAGVGVLSPLLYTLNVSIDLDGFGDRPVSGLAVVCGYACLGLLCVQFAMGRAVVRPEPIRLLPNRHDGK